MNNVPPFSQNRGDIKYIKFEILQMVSPSEDVKFSNVRGLYLRKYGKCYFVPSPILLFLYFLMISLFFLVCMSSTHRILTWKRFLVKEGKFSSYFFSTHVYLALSFQPEGIYNQFTIALLLMVFLHQKVRLQHRYIY